MEQLLRVDFGTNRVERTKAEWIQELTEYELASLDSIENCDATISYLLINGFVGYKNMNDDELIDRVYDLLDHKYYFDEVI